MICRICRKAIGKTSEWYPGFGRLCDDCDDRVEVVTNYQGHVVSVIDQGGREA